jgi:hypothetical protein
MPRSTTRRKKPTAAALATVLRVLEEVTPIEVSREITQSVFPMNPKIREGIAQTRNTLSRARELHARAVDGKRRQQLGWPQQQPGWPTVWNSMVDHLNTARDQLYATAKHASAKGHANMLKGNKRRFSRKALDVELVDRAWDGGEWIDDLQQQSEDLAALTGIPEEDIEWSRAADWADNIAGKPRHTHRRRTHRRRRSRKEKPRRVRRRTRRR